MKNFLKERKNRIIIYLVIAMIFFGFLAVKNKIDVDDEKCWLWILDENGNGVSGRVDWNCDSFKNSCESAHHNVPCIWVEENLKGCRCQDIW